MWNRDSERLSQNYLIIFFLARTILSATQIFFVTLLSGITWELSQRASNTCAVGKIAHSHLAWTLCTSFSRANKGAILNIPVLFIMKPHTAPGMGPAVSVLKSV